MRSAGQVISRESMTEQALGRKLVPYDRSIDTHISNLRRKLEPRGRQESRRSRTCAARATRSPWRRNSRTCTACSCGSSCCSGSRWRSSSAAASPSPSRWPRASTSRASSSAGPALAIQASEVLAQGRGRRAEEMAVANQHSMADRELYIIGPDGEDILGRRLSDSAARRLEFFRESMSEADPRHRKPGRLRAAPRAAAGRGGPVESVARAATACAAAASQLPPAARAAADLGAGRHHLHGAAGAAPPEHLRRAEPARDLAAHSRHRARGERVRELVARAAPERADPAHAARARARSPARNSTCA